MKNKVILTAILTFVVVLVGLAIDEPWSSHTAEGQTFPPSKFFGTVTVNGFPAPQGTVVRAKLGVTICGEAIIRDLQGVGSSAYNIDAIAHVHTQGCPLPGELVQFEWQSPTGEILPCSPRGIWRNITFNQMDLHCPAEAEVALLSGENLVVWQGLDCVPAENAFRQLTDQGLLASAWHVAAASQTWYGFDPKAPSELNSLYSICPGNVLLLNLAENFYAPIVWRQDVSENAETEAALLQSTPSAVFYGRVTLDGVAPFRSITLRATVGSKDCGQNLVGDPDDIRAANYTVSVAAGDTESGCGFEGDAVRFELVDYDNASAYEEFVFPCEPEGVWTYADGFTQLDLTCSSNGVIAYLYSGENFVPWLQNVCVPSQDAFSRLPSGALKVGWKLITGSPIWLGYDPDAPAELNALSRVCPGDILLLNMTSDAVWQQEP